MPAPGAREHVRENTTPTGPVVLRPAVARPAPVPRWVPVRTDEPRRIAPKAPAAPAPVRAPAVHQAPAATRETARWQHEMKEMQETQDLTKVDDDVERAATLLEWQAPEHTHRPKTTRWFVILAVGTTLVVGIMLFMVNFTGAIVLALAGGLLYYFAQQPPATVRYRLMVDGIAINNVLYHYRDLLAFNVVYYPGETTAVLLRSKHFFAPLHHLELGDADPVAVRDILIEYLPENQDLEEPLVDIVARRLGF